MRDYISLGPTPCDEPCAQVGTDNYDQQSLKECRAFIAQLRRQFGIEPMLAYLRVEIFPHDFGSYREVVCYFDTNDQEAMNYAFKLEAECPRNWDR